MKMNVKKGDTVLMIAGKDKGKKGKITSCDPKSGRVVVEGCNIITKHTKPRGANQPGGINKMAGPVDVSNVQILCPSCNHATRVAHSLEGDKKIRVCKKCGASLEPKKVEKKAKKSKAEKVEAPAEEVKEKKTTKKTAKKSDDSAEKKTVKKAVKKEADTAVEATENTADNGGEN